MLATALLLALTLNGGCVSGLSAAQRALLQDGRAAYLAGKWPAALDLSTRFIESDAAEKPEAAEAYYVRAMSRAKLNDLPGANADAREALRRAKDAELRWKTHVFLGTLQYEAERWREAEAHFAAAAQAMPAAAPLDLVLFRLGVCRERLGDWGGARRAYEQLVATFRSGVHADAARRRIKVNADAYSIQCGAFARRENAERLVEALRAKGLSAGVRVDPREGSGTLFVVLVGRYASFDQARQALPGVQRHVSDAQVWP